MNRENKGTITFRGISVMMQVQGSMEANGR